MTSSYQELNKFQNARKNMEAVCFQLGKIIEDGHNHGLLSNALTEESTQLSRNLPSQRFRIAIVGEFSQGKSTLINALLGEEIQPVRKVIACSGTITVFRYGAPKQIICFYKEKPQENLSIDEYKVKATISKKAALEHRSDELAHSDIDEIVFVHPDLDLCKSGVEILDSPGLNEHPDRTAITQKLLKDTDAAIFLTNAEHLLTETEMQLILDVKTQLSEGKKNEPANNLFVLVNFMDRLDEEEDRQNVIQKLENFVKTEGLLTGKNRIHYISAKAALNAILNRTEDEYLKAFKVFTQSLEKFLTNERGSIQLQPTLLEIKRLIQSGFEELDKLENSLDDELSVSAEGKQKILEQIGEASGRDSKIRLIAKKLKQESINQANQSWEKWDQGLEKRLKSKTPSWSAKHPIVIIEKSLSEDYKRQFQAGLSKEVDNWKETSLINEILKPKLDTLDETIYEQFQKIQLDTLDETIYEQFQEIQAEAKIYNRDVTFNLSSQLNLSISGTNINFFMWIKLVVMIVINGLLALVVLMVIFLLLGVVLIVSTPLEGDATIALDGFGTFAFGVGLIISSNSIKNKVKNQVVEKKLKDFNQMKGKLPEVFQEFIKSVFDNQVECASKAITLAISNCEKSLEQQEQAYQANLQECEAIRARITQKRQELEQLQKELEAIAQQIAG